MKRFLTSLMTLTLLLSLAACSSNKLADVFNEDEVVARAAGFIETISTRDYEAAVAEVREDLQDQLSADILKNALDSQLQAAGNIVDFTFLSAYGQKDKSTGEDYAVCVLVCKYENASQTFTVSMDKDLAIVGLYMK